MNISDPFCRAEKRRNRNYESVRSSLRENGVDSIDAALAVRATMIRNGVIGGVFVLMLVGLTVLLFPKAGAIALVFGVVILLWLLTLTLTGCGHVRRYIDDELSDLRH